MPGFCSPIALSIPAGVCTRRGVGSPNRGNRVTLLSTTAPISREIGERRKIFARAVAAAAHERRVCEPQLPERDRETRLRHHHLNSSLKKTGPSLQTRA